MVTENDFEISSEDEFCESETEDESYILEGECTEDENYGFEAEEESTEENEIQVDELKAKKGKKDIRRYCCQMCGLVRSKRGRIKEHIPAHHGVEIDTAGEVDKLIRRINIEETEIDELEAKKDCKVENKGSKERDVWRYCCEFCGLTISKHKLLKAHVISEHAKEVGLNGEIENFITKKCSEDGLQAERRAKNGTKDKIDASKPRDIRRYSCQICGLVRAKRKLLKVHIISHHSVEMDTKDEIDALIEKKNPEECEILESEVENSKKVENNGFKAMDLRRYCCKLCGLVRSKPNLLKNHIKSEHGIEMGSEDEADKFLVKRGSDDAPRRYSCQICGIVRSKRRLLKLHVISSHGPQALKKGERFALEGVRERSQHVCDLCGISFRKSSHLHQHKISHSALEGLRHLALLSKRWETTLKELGY